MADNSVNKESGILVIISGPSGSGKGTIAKELLSDSQFVFSISVTSRVQRHIEEEGVHYFFRTREYFENMIAENKLLEWTEFLGNYYGTPREYVIDRLNEGKNVILDIEVRGALQVKKAFPESVLIFVVPPNIEELRRRLTHRGTEQAEAIEARIRKAKEEFELIENYDYIVINDSILKAVSNILCIVRSEPLKAYRNINIIERIKGEIT